MKKLLYLLLIPAAYLLCQAPVGSNSFNGFNLQVPSVIAKTDASTQAANIGITTFYTIPANAAGTYRMTCYVVVTQQATVSGTVPLCQLFWKDSDSGVSSNANVTGAVGGSNPTVGTNSTNNTTPSMLTFQAAANSNIQYDTVNYASSGATPMQYAIHIKLEYLGQ